MNEARLKDIGYLVLRIGMGVLIAAHGWPKITGGPERWERLGENMSVLGITFLPVAWGFAAAISEFLGGICVALGILFRPACLLITFTLTLALISHLDSGDDFYGWVEAAEMGIAFLAMLIIGPGKYSLSVSLKG